MINNCWYCKYLQLMEIDQQTIVTLIKYMGKWRIKTVEDLYQWFERNRLHDRIMQNDNISQGQNRDISITK